MNTIFALSTAAGKSGVAIIRISGADAAQSVVPFGTTLPPPRLAALRSLLLADGVLLDRALVLYFPAPHSFTGEDVVELHMHGGRSIIRAVLAQLGALPGFRMAEPGEFTRRAFLNGKMDLTGAEGLADLIDADTEAQRRQAVRAMQGHAEVFFSRLREAMIRTLAYLEAYIDFPDEDIPDAVLAEVDSEMAAIIRQIEMQLQGARANERVREGVRIAIIGPPNAGKSSLLNMLAGREAAIVSHRAGTTRDVIEVQMDIGGYPAILIDTAGIREHEDEIEAEGIRRTMREARNADLKICLFENEPVFDDPALQPLLDDRTLLVRNKSDLSDWSATPYAREIFFISVKQGRGIEKLLESILARIVEGVSKEPSFVTRERHALHLRAARDHLTSARANATLALELRCEELRRAAVEIGKITGRIDVEEILGHIFSQFCIGK